MTVNADLHRLMPLARGTAGLIGIFGMAMGAYAILAPRAYATTFGLPRHAAAATTTAIDPFIAVIGGRTIASGLALTLCAAAAGGPAYARATGMLLMTGLVTGACDAAVVAAFASSSVRGGGSKNDGRRGGEGDSDDSGIADSEDTVVVVVGVSDDRRRARNTAWGHLVVTGVIACLGCWMVANST